MVYDFGGKAKPEDYYVFVGRLEEIKGIELLLDAFKKIPNQKIKVIGSGVLDEKIRERIQKESICNIELLGYKNRIEVNRIVRGAKALVMCSQWYETFGMVIVEAYSNGVPAIVGNIGNIKDLVEQDKTGMLFQYNSAERLAETILAFEEKCNDSFGKNSYMFYKNHFSPEKNYNQLMEIYASIKA